MKKLGIICFMTLLTAFVMNSCGGAGSNAQDKKIEDKIENGGDLTSEDYSRMINYVGEFAKKAQDIAVNSNNSDEQLAQLREEYPFLNLFRDCIANTPVDKLNESDLKDVAKYAGLVEFTTPIGYELTTDPKAAGMEVQTPDSENGVIAGGVDTVSVKK